MRLGGRLPMQHYRIVGSWQLMKVKYCLDTRYVDS